MPQKLDKIFLDFNMELKLTKTTFCVGHSWKLKVTTIMYCTD